MRIFSTIASFFTDMATMIYEIFVDGGWLTRTIMGVIAAFILWMGVEGSAVIAHSWEYYGDGTIINMTYEPARTTTSFVSDGNGGTRMQTNHISEKYILLVRVNDDAQAVQVTSKKFAATKEGDKVGVYRRYGIFLYAQSIGEIR